MMQALGTASVAEATVDLPAAAAVHRATWHRLTQNTLFTISGSVISVAVAIVTVPWYLRLIGEERYGVLAFVMVILSYFTIFDFGLDRAVANRLAQIEPTDSVRISDVFWSALVVNVCIGAIGGGILFISADALLPRMLHASQSLRVQTGQAVPLIAVALPIMTAISVVTGALEGRERFLLRSALVSGSGILVQILPILCAYLLGKDIPHLIGATVVALALTLLVALAATMRALRLQRTPRINAYDAKALARFGSWVTVSGAVSPLLTVMDRFAIGAIAGPVAVTTYTIPFSVVTRAWVIPDAFGRSLFPRLSALDSAGASRLAHAAVARLALLVTPLIGASILLAAPALRLWLGQHLGRETAPVAEVLLVGIWANSLAAVPYVYLQARGRPDIPARYHLAELIPYLIMLWIGLRMYGVVGAAWVWTARVVIDGVLVYRASRRTGTRTEMLTVGTPFYAAIIPAIAIAAAFVLAHLVSSLEIRALAAVGLVGLSGAWAIGRSRSVVRHTARKLIAMKP